MTKANDQFGVTACALRLAAVGLSLSVSGAALAQQPPLPAPQKVQPAATQPAAAPAAVRPAAPRPVAQPASPASAPLGRGDGDIVARAGDTNLTRKDVRAFVSTLAPAEQAALARDPALFSQALRVILANGLVLKEAQAKKWDEQPAVAAQIKRIRDNAVVESYLQSVSVAPNDFPLEADVQKVYEANKAALVVPRQFQVAQIFISLPAGATKDAEDKSKKKLADIQAKLKQPGADFAAVAKAESDERASGELGGEIGWLAESQLRPEIKAQILALEKGTVSEAIQVPEGWHIVKLLDAKPAGTAAFADVRDALVQRMRAQRIEANRRAYLSSLLEKSPPTINELSLAGVLEQAKTADSSK